MLCSIDQASKSASHTCTTTGRCVPADVANILKYLCGMFPKLHDRRVMPRIPYTACGAIAPANAGCTQEFWTYDMNRYTVGYVTRQPLASGTAGPIRIDLPDGACCEVRGRVMRSREFIPGWFEGYIAFSNELTEEAFAAVERLAE